MIKLYKPLVFLFGLLLTAQLLFAQLPPANMSFVVTMEDPATHNYHVVLTCSKLDKPTVELKMCAWTPGYYEILDFAKAVEHFQVSDAAGNELHWEKSGNNNWQVNTNHQKTIVVSYDLKATVLFVGNVYLDANRGYITPGGLFLYTDEALRHPVTVQMKPYSKWGNNLVATGLDSIPGKNNTFYAANYDVLYDSPFLMGKLEILPPFAIKGIPHNFIGYDMGQFDRQQFMDDLKKIIEQGINVIGEIPYTHYTFLSIGQGGGGIEHLNSTSVSFRNKDLMSTPASKKRFYTFLAHEYFHHYNVKRIRPIELGPFDYTKENYTNMLWVSEGFTDYYANLMVKHAGLMTDEDLLKAYQGQISAYENKPGHLYQSATQASHDTWTDFPFGKSDDELNKTISYYDKGCILGLMLDFKIRHETGNKQSLDNVMRTLYQKYYKTLKRGFTEKEFQAECEKIVGTPLTEVFQYASTVKPVNYPKYFAYAGLAIDTTVSELPGTYLGVTSTQKNGEVIITSVEWNSPAWNAGLRSKDKIVSVDNSQATPELLSNTIKAKNSGDDITLVVATTDNKQTAKTIKLGKKSEKSFKITQMLTLDALQLAI